MTQFPPREIRRVRLPHVCAACGDVIAVGTQATMLAGFDGSFWRTYRCVFCSFDDLFEGWCEAQTEKHLLGRL